MNLEDRLLEVRRMRVGDIAAHARNPKHHPARQQDALKETLRTLGQADVLKAYHSERNGGALTLYDGHARQGLDPFLGSGPSLKAAHRLGNRTVLGFELSPYYCDHVIEWAEAEGLHCERIASYAPAATDALALTQTD